MKARFYDRFKQNFKQFFALQREGTFSFTLFSLYSLALHIALILAFGQFSCVQLSAQQSSQPSSLQTASGFTKNFSSAFSLVPSQQLYFERVSYEQGLSESNVSAIVQDRAGFLWIGTTNGLNRYDGYKFTIFRHNPADSSSLVSNAITALYEDKAGMLWIGTQNGMSRYNPRTGSFTNYRAPEQNMSANTAFPAPTASLPPAPSNYASSATIFSNVIRAITSDSAGNIWIGTKRGLHRFDAVSRTFKLFKTDKKKTDVQWRGKGPTDSDILALQFLPAEPHILWLAPRTGGINALDVRTMKFAAFPIEDEDAPSVEEGEVVGTTNGIAAMTADAEGNIWIGARTDGNVFKFSPKTRTSERFSYGLDFLAATGNSSNASPMLASANTNITDNRMGGGAIHTLLVDKQGLLWVGTRTGLWMFDQDRAEWTLHTNSATDPNSISDNDVNTAFQDQTGVLWFGTQTGGLSKFVPQSASFRVFKYDPTSWRNALAGSTVTAFAEKRGTMSHPVQRGELWVATQQGLSSMLSDGTMRRETSSQAAPKRSGMPKLAQMLADKPILSLLHSRMGETLWIGTERGLVRVDDPYGAQKTALFSMQSGSENGAYSLSDDIVSALAEDSEGFIWAGTQGGGVNRINPRTNTVEMFLTDAENPRSLSDNFVFSIVADTAKASNGAVWIGTSNGLCRFDAATQDFTVWQRKGNSQRKSSTSSIIPDVPIVSLLKSGNDLWLGTLGGGLYRFDAQSGTATRFGRDEGLPSETIYGILQENSKRLWLGTSRGLVRMDIPPKERNNSRSDSLKTSPNLTVRVYNASDGLHSNTFHQGASVLASDGSMAFGVGMGLVHFVPEQIAPNMRPPKLGFVRFKIFGDREVAESLRLGDTITLEYNDNFEIEYAALDFTNTAKNEYAYKVEGITDEWMYVGMGRTVTGTNFDPKTYVLHIKAANSDGVWNEEGAKLTIIVMPPWWETWWFRSLAFLLGGSAILGGYKLRVRSINRQNERLTKLVEQRTYTLKEQSRLMEAQAAEIQLANGALQEKNGELATILHESEEARTELQRAYTLLDAENARKTQELEEARTFQVSMLPKKIPSLPHVELAFEMRTATEVGGDYYDYVLADDGTLTLAIGDATGHGVRAGMLVSLVKSSFHALIAENDVGTIVTSISQTIKQMNLQRMFMCLTLLRIRKHIQANTSNNALFVEFAGAGMPPMLHYSASTKTVAEHRPQGIALGVMNNAQYPTHAFTLECGDMLLLLSDGLVELFNGEMEELGTERLHSFFTEECSCESLQNAPNRAQHLISSLNIFANEWRGDTPQADDIALMVVRCL